MAAFEDCNTVCEEIVSSGWRYLRPKNRVVRGTWLVDEAFHVSLRHSTHAEDPLNLSMLSGFYTLPIVGVYDQSEYELLQPVGLLHLPDIQQPYTSDKLLCALPMDVQDCVGSLKATSICHAVVFHGFSHMVHLLDDKGGLREINVLPHTWVLQNYLDELKVSDWSRVELDLTAHIGVFAPTNVHMTCQDIVEELNGLPFTELGTRLLHVHHGRFSPNNCQIGLTKNQRVDNGSRARDHSVVSDTHSEPVPGPFHSFYTVIQDSAHSGSACLTFHIIPQETVCMDALTKCLERSGNLEALLRELETSLGACTETELFRKLLSA